MVVLQQTVAVCIPAPAVRLCHSVLCMSLQYLHAFINEVTILVPVLNDSKHTFAIYTQERTKQRWPIRLAAATEQEMHDWVCDRSVLCTVTLLDGRGVAWNIVV